jgi:hypothetical protein
MDATEPQGWTLELDDGGGAERVEKMVGPFEVNDQITAYDRLWIVKRIDPERHYAYAQPAE